MSTGTKSEALTANSQSVCLRGTLGTKHSPSLLAPGRPITGSSSDSSPGDTEPGTRTRYRVESTPEPQARRDILAVATPIRRRGKSMSRRIGQNGNVFVKPKCKNGRCNHKKGLCPKYGRYWVDQPGQHERLRKVISLGEVTQTMAERKLRDYIRETQVDSPETFEEVTSPTTTFKQQAQWWLDEMRAGRIVSRRKRKPIKPATLAGYEAAVNWLNQIIGETPLVDIKNEVAKQLVIKMRAANLSDKTIVNYIHVLQSVIASVVNDEGEQVHPRTWNSHFIGLPVVNPKKQNRPTRTAKEIEKILAAVAGRYRVLYALLAGSGLRIGEALAIRLGPLSDEYSKISDDCSTIYIRQAIWRGKEQDPKTDAAVRDVDVPKELAALLSEFAGDRKEGFLFCSASGKPLSARNIVRDNLHPALLALKQPRAGFHCFRRFRESVLQMSDARNLLVDYWMGHENREMGTRYAKQLIENIQWRKEWAEKIGLGFKLPTLESSVGLLGLPKQQKSKLEKVA